jgi:hypothetical protein
MALLCASFGRLQPSVRARMPLAVEAVPPVGSAVHQHHSLAPRLILLPDICTALSPSVCASWRTGSAGGAPWPSEQVCMCLRDIPALCMLWPAWPGAGHPTTWQVVGSVSRFWEPLISCMMRSFDAHCQHIPQSCRSTTLLSARDLRWCVAAQRLPFKHRYCGQSASGKRCRLFHQVRQPRIDEPSVDAVHMSVTESMSMSMGMRMIVCRDAFLRRPWSLSALDGAQEANWRRREFDFGTHPAAFCCARGVKSR